MKGKLTPAPAYPDLPIADILRDARLGDLKALAEEPFDYAAVPAAVEALFDLLEVRKTPYLLVGGLAVLHYVGGRNTRDIDLLMPSRAFDQLPELTVTERNADFARATFRGVVVDALFTRNRLFEMVRKRHATTLRHGQRTIPCATVEGLIIMKLYALPSLYRQGRFDRVAVYEADIANLIRTYRPGLDGVLAAIAPHVLPTDLEEIKKIAAEILGKVEQFDGRFGRDST